jgi:hypothetical protein
MLCLHISRQCCGSETFHYGSGSEFSMSSGSYFQKVPVLDPTFFLTKYDFKGPKMAFLNIIFKEYLNLVYKNGQNYEITPFLWFLFMFTSIIGYGPRSTTLFTEITAVYPRKRPGPTLR